MQVRTFVVNNSKDIETAFAAAVASRVEAMLATGRPVTGLNRKQIVDLAATHRIPIIGPAVSFAEAGALMSYSASVAEHLRRSAHMVDKILRGARPGDIPVELPTKFDLVVNLKTARALGITIPQSILVQASRVIE